MLFRNGQENIACSAVQQWDTYHNCRGLSKSVYHVD